MIGFQIALGIFFVAAPESHFTSEFKLRIQSLQSQMLTEDVFMARKSHPKIKSDLKALVELAQTPKESGGFRSSGFQIPARVMTRAWNSAREEFENGSSKRAYELTETALRTSSFHQAVAFSIDDLKGEALQKANFFFMIRDWKTAKSLYESAVLNFDLSRVSRNDLEDAILKIIAIGLQNEASLDRTSKDLRSYQAKSNIPLATKNLLATLISKLEGMKAWKLPRTPSFQQVTKWANEKIDLIESQAFRELDEVALVQVLYVSGLVNRWLDQYPQQIQPRVYLLLARVDDWLLNSFKASLAGLYLEECARAFPEEDESVDCYATLETRTMKRKQVTRVEALSKPDQQLLAELRSLRRPRAFR